MATLTRAPTGDDAESGSWTGASAGTRYTLVDDHPDAAGADYLTHGTILAGNITFTFAAFDVPAGSTIASVVLKFYDYKTASQACNTQGRIKVGGSYYASGSFNPTNGAYTLRTITWATNPRSGSAWTVDDVNGVGANALQAFGMLSSDANPSIRLPSFQIEVNYTEPASITGAGQIASAEAPGSPAIAASVDAAGVASLEAVGSLALATTIDAAGIASAEAVGQPTVGSAAHTIDAAGVAGAEAVGAPAVSAVVSAAGVASAEAAGSPAATATVASAGIASAEAFGQPSVGAAVHTVDAAGIASAEAIGQPGVAASVSAAGISSAEALGQPAVIDGTALPAEVAFRSLLAFWMGGATLPAAVEPPVAPEQPPQVYGGRRRPYEGEGEDDELTRQVREAWDYLDWLRERERLQAEIHAPDPAPEAPAIAELELDLVAGLAGAQVEAGLQRADPGPDLVAEAERQALLRHRAEEEALLLILSELV